MSINRFDTLLGYERTLTPMRAARAAGILKKRYHYSILDDDMNETKEIMSEAEFIVYALQRGRKLEESAERACHKCRENYCVGENICKKGKIAYHICIVQYGTEITKTGYHFAVWLIAEGLTAYDTVQAKIEADQAEKEKAEQETARAEAERQATAEAEQRAENEYRQWLYEAVRNYGGIHTPEGEKILIQRDIFMDIYGEYNNRAKELLVMIDNIENPRCRRDIIDRLRNSNGASIKTFEQITGIKLSKTQKERRVQLETISKTDYAERLKPYRPRKKREKAEYNDIFYKNERIANGGGSQFVEARGRLWKCNGYDFYITFIKNASNVLYTVTESQTGFSVAWGCNLADVQRETRELTRNMRGGKPLTIPFAQMVEQAVKDTGLSPLYKSGVNLPA